MGWSGRKGLPGKSWACVKLGRFGGIGQTDGRSEGIPGKKIGAIPCKGTILTYKHEFSKFNLKTFVGYSALMTLNRY